MSLAASLNFAILFPCGNEKIPDSSALVGLVARILSGARKMYEPFVAFFKSPLAEIGLPVERSSANASVSPIALESMKIRKRNLFERPARRKRESGEN